MPLQNRVLPDGTLVVSPRRGTMMGNRGGAFHDANQRLRQRHWCTRQWICCLLEFGGRRRDVMQPGRYTELFFLDEATALAAGHRPCFECRRTAANEFARLWHQRLGGATGRTRAADIDAQLHLERTDNHGASRIWRASTHALPSGSMIRHDGGFALVVAHGIRPWSLDGYGPLIAVPHDAMVDVLTPPSTVAVLGAGYVPVLHNTAAT